MRQVKICDKIIHYTHKLALSEEFAFKSTLNMNPIISDVLIKLKLIDEIYRIIVYCKNYFCKHYLN